MKVIAPTTFAAATHFVSSNAVETVATWAVGTTYASGAQVVYNTRIYQSLVGSNTGNTPSSSPTFWLDVGPSNIYAMFDNQISTATTKASSPLTVTLSPGLFNSVALLGLVGTSLTVTMLDAPAGSTVYSRTLSLEGSRVLDWYQYFFEPFEQIGEVVLTGLPVYGSSRLTVSISGGGAVAAGGLLWGSYYELGDAEHGATAGLIDYSRKETDAFGTTTFVRRSFSKRMSVRLMLQTDAIDKVQRILAGLRATPAVWIASDNTAYRPLTVYGFYRDFSLEVAYRDRSYCSLEIEGLI